MTEDDIELLAKLCERHANTHFKIALDNVSETSVDLFNIDKGLECIDRAYRLRSIYSEKAI